MDLVNIIIYHYGQSETQIGSMLYILNPTMFINATDNRYDKNILLIFDLSTQQYQDLSSYSYQPIANGSQPCVTADGNNSLFVIGGGIRKDSHISKTQLYNVLLDKWSLLDDINIARAAAGCVFFAETENIFLFGGHHRWKMTTTCLITTLKCIPLQMIHGPLSKKSLITYLVLEQIVNSSPLMTVFIA